MSNERVSELVPKAGCDLDQGEKETRLLVDLNQLTNHHRDRCPAYGRILDILNPGFRSAKVLAEVPFLPVGLFKSHKLISIPEEEIFKILTSSGTSGQALSRVYLDRQTADRQRGALVSSLTSILGTDRLPMIVIDSQTTISSKGPLSARGAGILGMMNFGRDHIFVLDEDLNLKKDELLRYLEKHSGKQLLVYGFTYLVWQYFYKQLNKNDVDLSNAVLIHSGGWKKLNEEQVDNQSFKQSLLELTRLKRIYNFYGMVEQIGSIFLEGEDGYLYAPPFADVIVRDPVNWKEAKLGETGVLQVLSTLPLSYPGHSILTEDLGVVHGIDDSATGRKGKRFSVLGRVPKVELRGCGDVHAYGRAQT
jgi:hypothetical protein